MGKPKMQKRLELDVKTRRNSICKIISPLHTAQIICIAVPNSYSEIAVHKEYAAWISTSTKKLYCGCTGSPIRDPRSGSRSDFSGSGSDLDPIFTPLDRIGSTLFVVFPDPIRSKLSQNFNEKLKKFDKNSRAFWLFYWNSTKFCLESTPQFPSLSL